MLLAATEASAKCTVTLKFTNNNPDTITVLGNDSQSRVNGGTWSKMNFHDVTVKPGATGSTSWATNMSCLSSAILVQFGLRGAASRGRSVSWIAASMRHYERCNR